MDPNNLINLLTNSTIVIVLVSIVCTTVPFAAIAALLFFWARKSKGQAQSSQTWPSVMGTVVNSAIQVSQSHDSNGHSSTSYTPRISYEYEVLGHRYRGDRINFGGAIGYGGESSAQAVVDRYVPGNQIRVYYNPKDPGEAVLERTEGSTSKIFIWIAVFILGMLLCTTIISIAAVVLPLLGMREIFEFLPAIPTP